MAKILGIELSDELGANIEELQAVAKLLTESIEQLEYMNYKSMAEAFYGALEATLHEAREVVKKQIRSNDEE